MEVTKKVAVLRGSMEEVIEAYGQLALWDGDDRYILDGLMGADAQGPAFRIRTTLPGELYVKNRELACRIISMTSAIQERFHRLLEKALISNNVEYLEVTTKWSKGGRTRVLHIRNAGLSDGSMLDLDLL